MVFKFTKDLSLEQIDNKRVIKKETTFKNKVVFVNGFSASGKTMLAPIISSMQNVESIIFPYEIEWISSFLYSSNIDKNSYQEFLKQYVDHTTYNQMMSRNSNFRPSDISSVLQSRKKVDYLKRLFQKGDNLIPSKIKLQKPIINFTSSHLIFFINEISEAFSERLLFIETFRDPLYMFKQIKILYNDVYIKNPEKIFTFQSIQNNKKSFFFDFFSKDDVFNEIDKINLNEFVVCYLERIFNFYFNLNFEEINAHSGKIIFMPFEKFVINPNIWIDEILKTLKIKKTISLTKELRKQKVPRKYIHQGYSRSVYKRYGNQSVNKKFNSSEDADKEYKSNILLEFRDEKDKKLFNRLEKISNEYRNWIKKFDDKISYG
jgi:hypothetical protein